MNVTIQKRYCFKQESYGGFGNVMADQKRLQEKHPETNVIIEYNERSTSTKYRIVRIDQVEVDVPDMPEMEDFGVPEYPKPETLPHSDIDVEVMVDPVQPAVQSYHVYPRRAVITRKLVVTHIPSGTAVERRIWSETADQWTIDNARRDLERELDPTYVDRMDYYKSKSDVYHTAMKTWRTECDRIIKEAHSL